jgi:hypothetical protein
VASGQTGGGLEIITPFKSLTDDPYSMGIDPAANFLNPDIEPTSETITAMTAQELDLVLGTSHGNILQYRRLSDHEPVKNRIVLDMPPVTPNPPVLSIDPHLLLKKYEDKEERRESNIQQSYAPVRCKSIFNSYITDHDHLQLSRLGYDGEHTAVSSSYSFGPLSERPLVLQGKRILSQKLQELCAHHSASNNDFLCSIPIAQLGIDLLTSNEPKSTKASTSRANPNKLLYSAKLKDACYLNADPRSKQTHTRQKSNVSL